METMGRQMAYQGRSSRAGLWRVLGGLAGIAGLLMGSRQPARAWPPLFGPEFTFTNPVMQSSTLADEARNRQAGQVTGTPESHQVVERMRQILVERCRHHGNCSVTDPGGAWSAVRVTYQDGWWFELDTDPGVVEVRAQPMTQTRIEALRSRMQEDIFEVARLAGVTPDPNVGMGHIHLDLHESFGNDAQLFRNFLVDFLNHSELSTGILEDDPKNAPSFASLTDEEQDEFRRIIRAFDAATRAGHAPTISTLARAIQRRIHHSNKWLAKYQALSLNRIDWKNSPWRVLMRILPAPRSTGFSGGAGRETLEIRALRAQASAEDFALLTRLFQKRIEYLGARGGTVPLAPAREPADTEAIQNFYAYVTESNLEYRDYLKIVPSRYQLLSSLLIPTAPSGGSRPEALPAFMRIALSNRDAALAHPFAPPPAPDAGKSGVRSRIASCLIRDLAN